MVLSRKMIIKYENDTRANKIAETGNKDKKKSLPNRMHMLLFVSVCIETRFY